MPALVAGDYTEAMQPKARVTIRRTTLEDVATVDDIRRDAILGIDSAEFDVDDLRRWADDRPAGYFADRIAAGDVVIAFLDAAAVAWGSSTGDYVSGVYIRAAASRRGVGRAIMSALEAEIRRRGHESAFLDASPNAVGFYLVLGYTQVGPVKENNSIPMKRALGTSSPPEVI